LAPASPDSLILRRPDDWHVHLRDGAMLRAVVGATASQFARAIVMPNLVPPITTAAAAAAYRQRILAALAASGHPLRRPLHTLDDGLSHRQHRSSRTGAGLCRRRVQRRQALSRQCHHQFSRWVSDPERITPVLATMERIGMPLLIHGEVSDPDVDIL